LIIKKGFFLKILNLDIIYLKKKCYTATEMKYASIFRFKIDKNALELNENRLPMITIHRFTYHTYW